MKSFDRIILIYVLLLSSSQFAISSYAQEAPLGKHSLQTGYGMQLQGSGDVFAHSLNVGYSYMFNERLSATISIIHGSVQFFPQDGRFVSESIWTVDPMITYTPFPEKLNWFSVSVGPSFRSYESISGDGYQQYDDSLNSQQFGSFSSQNIYKDEFAIGVTTMLNFSLLSKNHFLIQLHPIIQSSYTNGDIATGLLLSAGFRF